MLEQKDSSGLFQQGLQIYLETPQIPSILINWRQTRSLPEAVSQFRCSIVEKPIEFAASWSSIPSRGMVFIQASSCCLHLEEQQRNICSILLLRKLRQGAKEKSEKKGWAHFCRQHNVIQIKGGKKHLSGPSSAIRPGEWSAQLMVDQSGWNSLFSKRTPWREGIKPVVVL